MSFVLIQSYKTQYFIDRWVIRALHWKWKCDLFLTHFAETTGVLKHTGQIFTFL